ncbi:GNAT family N-acetyltransferase [Amycolatopsis rubida]|uniref:GNAT family N-acetyltransferase n=1 Tax=Amycolatopsis rubida TaxID=112413 RepID=A0ABX0BUF4_9PSEU|nr:GNAT family N-acetyltransferase [Amycolatopsis sp. M39]MYW91486.1 GNAT family N-acetyltransferase [Amycolatopsis rubida]NEC56471.1 GNAT family N-acetyltransferase [Amycolatopsis rubida]OAP23486.1 putative acetyltransferase [Amycolatopsis sp. M39]
MRTPEIAFLPPSAAEDAALVALLTDLVNTVYAKAEAGLWAGPADRTNAGEMAGLVRAGEIAVARIDEAVVGSVRIQRLAEDLGEFGLLAASPQVRGAGIGRELVRFAERHCRGQGCTRMQLELLVPRGWTHPAKEFLAQWYSRLGYRVVETSMIDGPHPELAPLLAAPCDFLIWHKDLG